MIDVCDCCQAHPVQVFGRGVDLCARCAIDELERRQADRDVEGDR